MHVWCTVYCVHCTLYINHAVYSVQNTLNIHYDGITRITCREMQANANIQIYLSYGILLVVFCVCVCFITGCASSRNKRVYITPVPVKIDKYIKIYIYIGKQGIKKYKYVPVI